MGGKKSRRGKPGRSTDRSRERWWARQEELRERKAIEAENAVIVAQGRLEIWQEADERRRQLVKRLKETARRVTEAEEALILLGAARVAITLEVTAILVYLETPTGLARELGRIIMPGIDQSSSFSDLFDAVVEADLGFQGWRRAPWDQIETEEM